MREVSKDIQGMRALAVGLVVLFHFWPGRLTGGFVGVDIFFVISGYLITSHLLSEVNRTGTVSLTRFWARRIRRLLPAAFTVLAFSVLLAITVIPRSMLQQTINEIGASAIYIENWLLAGNAVDYLAASNKPTVVQHYWSLSVEEQFYILWPVLIIVIAWVATRFRVEKTRAIGVSLAVVFVVSLAFSAIATQQSQASAYFITPTRVWEFAAGGMLAFAPLLAETRAARLSWLRLAAAWAGLALIGYAAVRFNGATVFPGVIALAPVLGTALLIYTRDNESVWSPSQLFRFGPAQFLGDISYSVYLWHWPLIIAAPFVLGHGLTMKWRLAILAVTLILAVATKYLIEDPARRATGRVRRRRTAFTFMAAGAAVLVAITGCTNYQITQDNIRYEAMVAKSLATGEGCFGASAMLTGNNCSDRFKTPVDVHAAAAVADTYSANGLSAASPCGRAARALHAPVMRCEYGDTKTPDLTLALVGDSHADHLLNPIASYGAMHHWKIVTYTKGGCSALESAATEIDPRSIECAAWGAKVRADLASDTDVDVVLFSNESKYNAASAADALSEWNMLRAAGKRVIAVHDVPGMPKGVKAPECVEVARGDDPCSWKPNLAGDFMTVAANDPSTPTPIVDLTDLFCTSACHAMIGGVVVYFDDNHLTTTYARSLAPFLGKRIEAALAG